MTLSSQKAACIAALCCALTGCAQNHFRASELPGRYAARPIRDYSNLDLAQYTKRSPDADTILPGDHLQVSLDPGTLEEDSQLVWNVSVDDSGETSLPNIGRMQLAGLTRTQAENAIVRTSLERDVFLTPTVDVAVADRREQVILVTGAVGKPGPLKVQADELSLADVVVRAGGLTGSASGVISVNAAAKRVQPPTGVANAIQPVASTSVQAMTVSLESTPADEIGQLMIPAGAVVHVEPNPPRPIKVTGVIRNQAVDVPAGQNVRLLDALALAGGPSYSNWISDRVTVIRTDPATNQTIRISASVREARRNRKENILLAPHDIVNVEENIVTFTLSTLGGLLGAGVSASQIAL